MKYFKYILKHKWYVFLYCCKLGIPLRGFLHDFSKFYPSEWFPYNEYFYGNPKSDDQFNLAWLKHQKKNRHHWQYWVLLNDSGTVVAQKMPSKYIKEMVADWCGAGIAISGRLEVWDWYAKNKQKMNLHSDTRTEVVKILTYLHNEE